MLVMTFVCAQPLNWECASMYWNGYIVIIFIVGGDLFLLIGDMLCDVIFHVLTLYFFVSFYLSK